MISSWKIFFFSFSHTFFGDDPNCFSKFCTTESCPNPLFLLAIITLHSAGAHNVFHKKTDCRHVLLFTKKLKNSKEIYAIFHFYLLCGHSKTLYGAKKRKGKLLETNDLKNQ